MFAVGEVTHNNRFFFVFSRQGAMELYQQVEEELREDMRMVMLRVVTSLSLPETSPQTNICVGGAVGHTLMAGWSTIQERQLQVALRKQRKIKGWAPPAGFEGVTNGYWTMQDGDNFTFYVFYGQDQALQALEKHVALDEDSGDYADAIRQSALPLTAPNDQPMVELSGAAGYQAALGMQVAIELAVG